MNKPIIILVAVFSSLATAETASGVLNFINLGQVDGKNYFYDGEELRNWTASGAFCQESGMQLATIETASQAVFLASKSKEIGERCIWTAGRDAQLPRQFTWNGTETIPTDTVGLSWTISSTMREYKACVMFCATSPPILAVYPCVNPTWVLCQTRVGDHLIN